MFRHSLKRVTNFTPFLTKTNPIIRRNVIESSVKRRTLLKDLFSNTENCLFGKELKPWQRNVCIGTGGVLGVGFTTGVYYCAVKGILYTEDYIKTCSSFNDMNKYVNNIYQKGGFNTLLIDSSVLTFYGFGMFISGLLAKNSINDYKHIYNSLKTDMTKQLNCCTTIKCTSGNIVNIMITGLVIPSYIGFSFYCGYSMIYKMIDIRNNVINDVYTNKTSITNTSITNTTELADNYNEVEENTERIV